VSTDGITEKISIFLKIGDNLYKLQFYFFLWKIVVHVLLEHENM